MTQTRRPRHLGLVVNRPPSTVVVELTDDTFSMVGDGRLTAGAIMWLGIEATWDPTRTRWVAPRTYLPRLIEWVAGRADVTLDIRPPAGEGLPE